MPLNIPALKLPNNRTLAIVICGIALIAIFFILFKEPEATEMPVVEEKPVFTSPFASTTVEARGAFVYAPTSKHIMFQSNAHVPLPLASVTKIMTAYVASTILDDDDVITITQSDIMPEGDHGLFPGEQWRFDDLRDVMLVASANDAAEAIRRATDDRLALRSASTTIGIMNEKARELGWHSLSFESVSGLDTSELEATAFGNARDVALMFTYAINARPDIFEATRESVIIRGPLNGTMKTYSNTNITINDMPSIIASKTGFTDAAGGNLIAVFDAGLGLPIVIAVLGSDNQRTRFTDMQELSDKALRYISGTYYTGTQEQ